jgi:hypothetical protein
MRRSAPCVTDGEPVDDDARRQRCACIDSHYQDCYQQLDKAGQPPYRHTRLGAWAASVGANVFDFFSTLQLGNYRLLIDLGSGDGVVACIAGLFTRAVGIEIDPLLCGVARHAVRQLQLQGQVDICCGDYRKLRIWQADCLYLYPDKPLAAVEALLADWQGHLLVAGPHFAPRNFEPLQILQRGRDQLVVYGCR